MVAKRSKVSKSKKANVKVAETKAEAVIEEIDAEDVEEALANDPYILKDKDFDAANPSTRWTNKQRTLVFATRGITAAHRHMMDDLKRLLPHSKSEPKWDKSQALDEIVETAELANCNNVLFFEARKHTDLYLWMARTPNGPSVKFQVLNIHTLGGINLTGNCLLGSRPLLVFDKNFEELPQLRLLKEMFVQIWGTPRHHPKSKPFHDHVMSFYWTHDKIWFRHYQIYSEAFSKKVDQQTLREIGPRFVLDPIRIFENPFGGKTLWKNPAYTSSASIRAQARRELGIAMKTKHVKKVKTQEKRSVRGEKQATRLGDVFPAELA